ncbi:MAG: hypothetical protein WCL06_05910 [Bacteroidota bacterium]
MEKMSTNENLILANAAVARVLEIFKYFEVDMKKMGYICGEKRL